VEAAAGRDAVQVLGLRHFEGGGLPARAPDGDGFRRGIDRCDGHDGFDGLAHDDPLRRCAAGKEQCEAECRGKGCRDEGVLHCALLE
jgi:hypothetical protein